MCREYWYSSSSGREDWFEVISGVSTPRQTKAPEAIWYLNILHPRRQYWRKKPSQLWTSMWNTAITYPLPLAVSGLRPTRPWPVCHVKIKRERDFSGLARVSPRFLCLALAEVFLNINPPVALLLFSLLPFSLLPAPAYTAILVGRPLPTILEPHSLRFL